jgi:hypothetical protein
MLKFSRKYRVGKNALTFLGQMQGYTQINNNQPGRYTACACKSESLSSFDSNIIGRKRNGRDYMKRLIPMFIFCFTLSGCRQDPNRHAMNWLGDDWTDANDTMSYPLTIEDGSKVVYQFGHMTPDKGLKLYLDTIPSAAMPVALDKGTTEQLTP